MNRHTHGDIWFVLIVTGLLAMIALGWAMYTTATQCPCP